MHGRAVFITGPSDKSLREQASQSDAAQLQASGPNMRRPETSDQSNVML